MSGSRIVFLDIDGVLCTRKAAGWTRDDKPMHSRRVQRPVRALDGGCISRLNAICRNNAATVVVTSMWRIERDVPNILKAVGFSGSFHADWRTDADGPTRAAEIMRWLDGHGAHEFIVIDDWLQGLESLRNKLVLTNNYLGLELWDVDRAAELFGRPSGR